MKVIILYSTICWWPTTPGKKKKPGTLSRSHRQRMDGITFISQQQALKSQLGVKLSAIELVRCTVFCVFNRSCSHGPVIKPKPNQTT